VEPLTLPADVERALRKEQETWKNYQAFPESYQRVRIAFIESARRRPDEFAKRLRHFVQMTSRNKRFGWVKEFR
jgi:hypothetical protein